MRPLVPVVVLVLELVLVLGAPAARGEGGAATKPVGPSASAERASAADPDQPIAIESGEELPPPPREPGEEGTDLSPTTPPPEPNIALGPLLMTFIPLPIIFADPNVGVGGGVMPVFLFQRQGRIEMILAPSIDFTEIHGASVAGRLLYFPDLVSEFDAYTGLSLGSGNFEHELRYRSRHLLLEETALVSRLSWLEDGTRRFFGFGAETEEDDETNYQIEDINLEALAGYRIADLATPALTLRYRRTVEIDDGLLSDIEDDGEPEVPSTIDAFPGLPGTEGDVDVVAIGAKLTLDARDSVAIPSQGFLVDVSIEGTDEAMGADTAYVRYGVEALLHFPVKLVDENRWIHVMRGYWQHMDGRRDVPFYERPTLGGAVNLRGFGAGRFVSDGFLVFAIEERVRFVDLVIRENRLRFEIAPFLDIGRVYGDGGDGLDDGSWQFVPGLGGRILLPDSDIVAKADFGFGSEGIAAFILLGYPF